MTSTTSAEPIMRALASPRLAAIVSRTVSERAFFGVSALLFVASVALTIAGCARMSAMGTTPMPWTPMCGQTWLGAMASFVGMWTAMTVAMMMPSLVPMLWQYRRAVEPAGAKRLDGLTAMAGVGYFAVWSAFGIVAFMLGAALVSAQIRSPLLARAAPLATGGIVLIAGLLQFTAWKARTLACCRHTPNRNAAPSPTLGTAWRHGMRLGRHCGACCAGLTAVLLACGAMDWRVMIAVSTAITAERWMPNGERVTHGIGAVLIAMGVALIVFR